MRSLSLSVIAAAVKLLARPSGVKAQMAISQVMGGLRSGRIKDDAQLKRAITVIGQKLQVTDSFQTALGGLRALSAATPRMIESQEKIVVDGLSQWLSNDTKMVAEEQLLIAND